MGRGATPVADPWVPRWTAIVLRVERMIAREGAEHLLTGKLGDFERRRNMERLPGLVTRDSVLVVPGRSNSKRCPNQHPEIEEQMLWAGCPIAGY